MDLDGVLAVGVNPTVFNFADASVTVTFRVNGSEIGSTNTLHQSLRGPGSINEPQNSRRVLLNTVRSPDFTVLANTPFTLEIQLESRIFASGFGTIFNVIAAADFLNTLSFASNGPVFNLENGYSANSLDAGIVANAFAAPVPLPTSLLFGASALFTLFATKVTRRGACHRGLQVLRG